MLGCPPRKVLGPQDRAFSHLADVVQMVTWFFGSTCVPSALIMLTPVEAEEA